MDLMQIIFIGIGLAMDAFAVSVTSGVAINNMKIRHAVKIALFFGFFQALMPYIGWKTGTFASSYIKEYDHWIAFILLAGIGIKMIYESFSFEDDSPKDPLNIYVLFSLAIATSIDALAVGITFSFLSISILEPVLLIGIITFILSFIGTIIGDKLGHLFEKKLEIIGGLILIGIGFKILIEHTLLN